MKNYYMVMDVELFSEHLLLKEKYFELAKIWHPDKCLKNISQLHLCDNEKNPKTITEYFQLLNEAWGTLRNMDSKLAYDDQLKQHLLENQVFVSNIINIDEMVIDDENELTYGCRCGGEFEVDIADVKHLKLSTNDLILQCSSCSLYLKVLFNTELT